MAFLPMKNTEFPLWGFYQEYPFVEPTTGQSQESESCVSIPGPHPGSTLTEAPCRNNEQGKQHTLPMCKKLWSLATWALNENSNVHGSIFVK